MSSIPLPEQFLGRGLLFPIELDSLGRAKTDTGIILIRSAIRNILAFLWGTRYLLGNFGSKLEFILEQPNDEMAIAMAKTYIVEAITFWEKRVDQVSLTISVPANAEHQLNIFITYRIKNTKISDSFIYPYYSQLIY